ncbi:MAG TPA: phasin family protein [Terriglobales bacterium]|nr:phasin family protein [Terriglobales bacterium]
MSEKINEQAEKMREMAQTTLDKAKEAVSKYMAESQKLREKADSSVRASYSAAKEMNEKAVAFAEANVQAGFELAERLLQAKDPQEMGTVYQSHLKEQIEKMSSQFRELGSLISTPAPVDLSKSKKK